MPGSERRTVRPPAAPAKFTGEELLITRTFDAPRELVFDAFTKREHLERWEGRRSG